ncbi:hypothetical protein [Pyrodictium abyssi]|uniref:Uncharacterized protein n=1 Tax=Pyrodictium abyssi TaxID=54256 RepID=A0ABN6ZLD1_9CREN|nr:hypothetical protein PABY_06160 [Pyrodictium abyssi]
MIQLRGVVRSVFYELPGYRYFATMPMRVWDLASVAAMLWVFYRRVELVEPSRDPLGAEVLVASEPRGDAPSSRELWETLPEQLQGAIGNSGSEKRGLVYLLAPYLYAELLGQLPGPSTVAGSD